jgi:predicted naringenin-chalcone synthase
MFLVSVSLKPTAKAVFEDGIGAVVVVNAVTIEANDEAQAVMMAARLVPAEHADKGDRLQVGVIPFRTTSR